METLLLRQLQQAWLETQMRKRNGDLSSSSSSSSSTALNPFSQQFTPSSSASSWAHGAEASSVTAPPMQSQVRDEKDFHDPTLHFIEKMLMEEDLDDRKCMMAECDSYYSMAKGFYDILGSGEVPLHCMSESECLRVSEQASKDFVSNEEFSARNDGYFGGAPLDDSLLDFHGREDEGILGLSADEESHFGVSAQNDDKIRFSVSARTMDPLKFDPLNLAAKEFPLRVPVHETEGVLNVNGEELPWIDDLFVNRDTIAREQHAPVGVVPSLQASFTGHSDSLGSTDLSSLHSFNSSSHVDIYEQNPPFKSHSVSSSSVPPGSLSISSHWSNNIGQHMYNGNGKHSSILGANATNSWNNMNTDVQHATNGNGKHDSNLWSNETSQRWSHGISKFARSPSSTIKTLPSSRTLSASGTSRLKRAASEIDASVASDNIISSSSGSSGIDFDSMEGETVSYVRNKDLNAEKFASILNDGIGAMKEDLCCKSSSASVRKDGGKPTLIVTTVADLKGLLISCAEAVASNNLRRAHEILQEIRQDASPYGNALQRLAHYFAEGLVARLSGTGDRLYSVFTSNSPSAAKMLKAHNLYVEVCPFVKISHYFANRAIVKAAKGASRLHIIDYGILYGLQWPSLISALAERKGGPPLLRITGIDFPQPGMLHAERVQMTGKRLKEYAATYGVPFEYLAIASRWDAVQPSLLNLKQDELVIVNSMNRLQNLPDETMLASNPRKTVLTKIREINPKIFVHGIQNGNYNTPFFLSRFKEALASFYGCFDMLETMGKSDSQERMMIEREVLGRNILNVVACEGPERVVRPEIYRQWQNRTLRAGFDPIPLNRNVLKESQAIVRCGYNKNFSVDEDGSWMVLSWKGKVAHALSLWKPASK